MTLKSHAYAFYVKHCWTEIFVDNVEGRGLGVLFLRGDFFSPWCISPDIRIIHVLMLPKK